MGLITINSSRTRHLLLRQNIYNKYISVKCDERCNTLTANKFISKVVLYNESAVHKLCLQKTSLSLCCKIT